MAPKKTKKPRVRKSKKKSQPKTCQVPPIIHSPIFLESPTYTSEELPDHSSDYSPSKSQNRKIAKKTSKTVKPIRLLRNTKPHVNIPIHFSNEVAHLALVKKTSNQSFQIKNEDDSTTTDKKKAVPSKAIKKNRKENIEILGDMIEANITANKPRKRTMKSGINKRENLKSRQKTNKKKSGTSKSRRQEQTPKTPLKTSQSVQTDETPAYPNIFSPPSRYSVEHSEISDAGSWTKQMCSLEAVTVSPVTVNDIVKIDGKLPFVSIVKQEIKSNTSSKSSAGMIEILKEDLYCSSSSTTSSSTSSSSSQTSSTSIFSSNNNQEDVIPMAVTFDTDFMIWSSDKTATSNEFYESFANTLKEECDILKMCEMINLTLNDVVINKQNIDSHLPQPIAAEIISINSSPPFEGIFVKPASKVDLPDKPILINENNFSEGIEDNYNASECNENNNNVGKSNDLIEYDDNDDCLSIYESSIADSLWLNNDTTFDNEQSNEAQGIVLNEEIHEEQNETNAENDSTTNFHNSNVSHQNAANFQNSNTSEQPTAGVNLPKLPTSRYNVTPLIKSKVYSKVCIFFLIGNCRKGRTECRFAHRKLSNPEIACRLQTINNTEFIQDYMLLRNIPYLRHFYLSCFIKDCIRRCMWDLLIEMAIDVYKDSTQERKKHLECILLGFVFTEIKSVNLLDYALQENLLVCDMFMKVIAESDNFSQFKSIFIDLTKFFVNIKRKFNLMMATSILERVYLLPCHRQLVEAVLRLIYNTDPVICGNPLIVKFEGAINDFPDLLEELKKYREHINEPAENLEGVASQVSNNTEDETSADINNPADTDNLKSLHFDESSSSQNDEVNPIAETSSFGNPTRPQVGQTDTFTHFALNFNSSLLLHTVKRKRKKKSKSNITLNYASWKSFQGQRYNNSMKRDL